MKYQPFTSHIKMADVIAANHSLLLVLPRLGIRLGFGEQSVKEVCDRYQLDVDFVLLIFNVYTFDNYLPDSSTFAATNLQPLVPYLQSSHQYYLNERLPHIKRHLLNVAASAGDRYGAILRQFFADYEKEVEDHFSFEEQHIFPLLKAAGDTDNLPQRRGKPYHNRRTLPTIIPTSSTASQTSPASCSNMSQETASPRSSTNLSSVSCNSRPTLRNTPCSKRNCSSHI